MKKHLFTNIFFKVILMMVGFGIMIGILFPFFIVMAGIPSQLVMNTRFFTYCIIAGIIVAIMNIIIVKKNIIQRISTLSHQMSMLENTLIIPCTKKGYECNSDNFLLKEDSDDTLGESVKAFNRLITSLSKALKFESNVRSFTEMLSKQQETDILSSKALALLLDYLSAQDGLILYKEDGQPFLGASSGVVSKNDLSKNPKILHIMHEGKLQLLPLNENEATLEGIEFKHQSLHVVIMPILYENVSIGVLLLSKNVLFTEEDIRKLEIFGMSLSIALSNTLAHERLQVLASKDPLTDIYNRRFGSQRLHEEYSRAVRGEYPLGIIMLDIDHFKDVNDSYGHMTGDRVLIHIATLIKKNIREEDILIRYGGEEFLCILPGADRDTTQIIAERMRKKIMENVFKLNDNHIQITISGGISSYPETLATSPEILINEADKALYRAKNLGRNNIVC